MSLTTGPDDDQINRRLNALVEGEPELGEACRFYGAVLPLLRDADLRAATVTLSSGEVRTRMESGRPLLQELDLDVDIPSVGELLNRLVTAVVGLDPGGERGAEARRFKTALDEERIDVGALLRDIASGAVDSVAKAAEGLGLDPDLVLLLGRNAITPALHAWRRQVTDLVENTPWRRGYCFVCGSPPVLAELQGNELAKHLRCGQCGSDWVFPRLQCPSCGNEDHRTLGVLYDESRRETMRVEVCEQCRGYHKVIVTFSPTPPELLHVEDLATLHLDYMARGRGYARVTVRP